MWDENTIPKLGRCYPDPQGGKNQGREIRPEGYTCDCVELWAGTHDLANRK